MKRVFLTLAIALNAYAAPPVEVTVSEGTSMSVAVSPDGRTLAIDLQGSIWTLPATGGTAKRITMSTMTHIRRIWGLEK